MRQETIAITGQMHAIRHKMTGEVSVSSKELEDKTAGLSGEIETLKSQLEEANSKHQDEKQKSVILSGEVLSLKDSLEAASGEATKLAGLAEKAGQVDGLVADVERLTKELEEKTGASEGKIAELTAVIEEKEAKIIEGDEIRRKMHNTIQELRGNIRVYVRVRPFLPGDGVDLEVDNKPCTTCRNDGVTAEIVKIDDAGTIEDSHVWEFDKCFGPADGQDEIFDEVGEFVQSSLDGFNVCLFSYGQTGSGKTHTMQGAGHGDMRGIIPRAIEQIGTYRDLMKPKGWIYDMHVTFVEIYNEIVFDLLRDETAEKQELDIKQDAKGKTFVQGANMLHIDPSDQQQIDDLMDTAALHRATSATNMNAQSSRSHSVFTLHLTGVNDEQGAKIKGQLHLCDLAGSERIARSGAEGDRLKEAININKSLSCLTDVFNSLAQKAAYIPFRNSKLTYLLQPALSGEGKTMMFVNVSPTNESYFESLCSLRFANNVNQVELGKAVKNVSEMSAKELEKRKNGGGEEKTPPKGGKSPPRGASAGGKAKAGAGRGGANRSKTMR
jgi:kinesin family protein C1